MHDFSASGLSCLERARLADELGEARTRGRNRSPVNGDWLRRLTAPERAALEKRERLAQARLSDHDAERLPTVKQDGALDLDGILINRVIRYPASNVSKQAQRFPGANAVLTSYTHRPEL